MSKNLNTMEIMTGTRYFRLRERLPQKGLAEKAGVSIITINHLEHRLPDHWRANTMLKVAQALNVTVTDLLTMYASDCCVNQFALRGRYAHSPINCISQYLYANQHSLRTLAPILHCSYERVRQLCNLQNPPEKYIRRLADYENLTESEFKKKFAPLAQTA